MTDDAAILTAREIARQPFWSTVRSERLVPEGGLHEIWSSPAYNIACLRHDPISTASRTAVR